jgi:hypothetical protein
MTNVSYMLLQKVPRVLVKIRTCKVMEMAIPMYCGNYDHQTMIHYAVPKRGIRGFKSLPRPM